MKRSSLRPRVWGAGTFATLHLPIITMKSRSRHQAKSPGRGISRVCSSSSSTLTSVFVRLTVGLGRAPEWAEPGAWLMPGVRWVHYRQTMPPPLTLCCRTAANHCRPPNSSEYFFRTTPGQTYPSQRYVRLTTGRHYSNWVGKKWVKEEILSDDNTVNQKLKHKLRQRRTSSGATMAFL